MAKADRLKEEIGWLKLIFAVLAAVDASLVAWLAQNYTTVSIVILFAGLTATVFGTGAILWTIRLVRRRLKELEEA